jgi:hypothetical protein
LEGSLRIDRNRVLTVFLLFPILFSSCLFYGGKVFAVDFKSENFGIDNANFGEQIFFTARDNTKPITIANGPEVIDLTPYTATVKWLTSKLTTSSIFYGTVSGQLNLEMSKAYDSTSVHEVQLVNLTPQTKYYFKARFKDQSGNDGESEEKSFTTPLPVPQITNITVKDISETSATVTFNTDFFTTCTLEYIDQTSLEKKNVGESGYLENHSLAIDNLRSDQKYTAIIYARDNEGHESVSSSLSFYTLKDETAPQIENVKFETSAVSDKGTSRIIASWHTSEASNSQIKYREGQAEEKDAILTPLDNDVVTNHVETISNLKPQTTYRIVLQSTDAAGNVGNSEEYIILTPKQKKTFFQIILDNITEIFKPFSEFFS